MHDSNPIPSVESVARGSALQAQAYEAGKLAYAEWDRTSRNDSSEDDVWHAALIWASQHDCAPPFARNYHGPIGRRPYVEQRADRVLGGGFAIIWPAFRQGWCCTADSFGDSPEHFWFYVWCGEERGWSWP